MKKFALLTAIAGLIGCSGSTPAPQPVTPAPTPAPTPNAGRGGPPPTTPAPQVPDTTGRGGLQLPGAAAQPRPYNRVVTPDAKTRRGMFLVHRIGDRV